MYKGKVNFNINKDEIITKKTFKSSPFSTYYNIFVYSNRT